VTVRFSLDFDVDIRPPGMPLPLGLARGSLGQALLDRRWGGVGWRWLQVLSGSVRVQTAANDLVVEPGRVVILPAAASGQLLTPGAAGAEVLVLAFQGGDEIVAGLEQQCGQPPWPMPVDSAITRQLTASHLIDTAVATLGVADAARLVILALAGIAHQAAASGPAAMPTALLRQVMRVVQHGDLTQLTTAGWAAQAGITREHLIRIFSRGMGMGPGEWLLRQRIAHARRLLKTTDLPVVDIAARCGWRKSDNFSRSFQRLTGLTPQIFRQSDSAPIE
jgi:AraC-like DNA-binding protein